MIKRRVGTYKLFFRTIITAIGILGISTFAQANKLEPSNKGGALSLPIVPDFAVLSVSNKHSKGSKGRFRYGSCNNDFHIMAKNHGDSYKYGDFLTPHIDGTKTVGGQVIVRLQLIDGRRVKWSKTQMINSWNKNEVKNVYFSGNIPRQKDYVLKASIIPCKRGSSATNCPTFRDKRSHNNQLSLSFSVTQACL